MEVPEAPAEVFKTLTLLEMSSNFGAYFPCFGERIAVVHVVKGDKRLVALELENEGRHWEGVNGL